MKDSLGVPVKVSNLGAVRVFPETELVVAKTVGTQDLSFVFIPDEGTDLAVGIDSVDKFSRLYIPKAHSLVRCSSSCC